MSNNNNVPLASSAIRNPYPRPTYEEEKALLALLHARAQRLQGETRLHDFERRIEDLHDIVLQLKGGR